jgi:hypothetical protein
VGDQLLALPDTAVKQSHAIVAESAAKMLEALDVLEVEADRIARAQYVRSAATDSNPHRRRSAMGRGRPLQREP